jgi:hypothetical protein
MPVFIAAFPPFTKFRIVTILGDRPVIGGNRIGNGVE